MNTTPLRQTERRAEARLTLAYPIRVEPAPAADEVPPGRPLRTVTRDLSARGAYFTTYVGDAYAMGQELTVVITVPHRLAGSSTDVLLDLRGPARVVRKDTPARGAAFGENGLSLTGIALQFSEPLRFRFAWV